MNLTVEQTDTIITITAQEMEGPEETLRETLGDMRSRITTPRVHIQLEGPHPGLNCISTILLFIVELRRSKIRTYLRAAPDTLTALNMMGMGAFFEQGAV